MGTQVARPPYDTEFQTDFKGYTGGGIASREGVLRAGGIAEVDMDGINLTGLSMVTVQVTGCPLRISAAANAGNVSGSKAWEVGIVTIVKSIVEFATLIGADQTHTFIKVENPGPFPTHYRIIFTNLED
jgi:hypothetical protein